MQPLATAEDGLSFREIETSVFHGRTSPCDPIGLAHLVKDMAFISAVGAPSLGRSDSIERPTGRPTEPPPTGRVIGGGGKTFRESALSPGRRSSVSGWKPIVASPSAGPLAGRAVTTDHRPTGRERELAARTGADGHRQL